MEVFAAVGVERGNLISPSLLLCKRESRKLRSRFAGEQQFSIIRISLMEFRKSSSPNYTNFKFFPGRIFSNPCRCRVDQRELRNCPIEGFLVSVTWMMDSLAARTSHVPTQLSSINQIRRFMQKAKNHQASLLQRLKIEFFPVIGFKYENMFSIGSAASRNHSDYN